MQNEQVRREQASGRAFIVARALQRERRRVIAEHDAKIYAAQGDDPELDDFTSQAARQPLDVD